jgi:gliding motility-associated-like protein
MTHRCLLSDVFYLMSFIYMESIRYISIIGILLAGFSLSSFAQEDGWIVLDDKLTSGKVDSFCLDLNDFVGEIVIFENTCPNNSGTHVDFKLDTQNYCIYYQGILPGAEEEACILACDKFGNCDSLSLRISCVTSPLPDTTLFSIKYGQSIDLCIDTTELFSTPVSYSWESQSGSLIHTGDPLCRKYTHKPGFPEDIIQVVVCDSFQICDTSIFLIEASPYQVELFTDTVILNFGGSICLDTSELPLEIATATPILVSDPGDAVSFSLLVSQFCIEYEGKGAGIDTLQVLLRDAENNTDTALLAITCLLPQPEYITDTLFTGETGLYCLNDSELAASIASFTNTCLPTSTSADYQADIQSLCINVEAQSPGLDSACYVLCDQLGACDTFYLKILVQLDLDQFRIEAIDDRDTTLEQTLLQLDVLDNDLIPGTITDFYLLDPSEGGAGPQYGLALEGSPGNRIGYAPEDSFCGGQDYFTYVVCNEYFCDTALVSIYVLCVDDPIQVHNGFSPNGDGINDTFVITGLEFFDQHHLSIYNRWGSLVFESSSYQNDWEGDWKGSPLPDGTYFYRLEVDFGRVYSGYIEVMR